MAGLVDLGNGFQLKGLNNYLQPCACKYKRFWVPHLKSIQKPNLLSQRPISYRVNQSWLCGALLASKQIPEQVFEETRWRLVRAALTAVLFSPVPSMQDWFWILIAKERHAAYVQEHPCYKDLKLKRLPSQTMDPSSWVLSKLSSSSVWAIPAHSFFPNALSGDAGNANWSLHNAKLALSCGRPQSQKQNTGESFCLKTYETAFCHICPNQLSITYTSDN